MSDKCHKVTNQIYKKHKEIHKLDWVFKMYFAAILIFFILYCLNFYSNFNSIIGYIILTTLTVFIYFLIYRRSGKYTERLNKYSMVCEVMNILNDYNLNKSDSIQLLKKELEKESSELKDEMRIKKERMNRLFLYVFWIPFGFLLAYYFNSNDAVLAFYQLKEFSLLLLGLAIQLIALTSILSLFEKEAVYLIDNRRKKCDLTLDYLNDCLYDADSLTNI